MKDSSRRSNSSRENLWSDSDNEEEQMKSDPSNENIFPISSCCLICSILPNLSHINTCSNHLQLLHRSSLQPTQVVYMMHPCSCQRKSKHRCRSMSSSSSESEYRSRRKKRAMTIQSSSASSQEEQFFSPIHRSQPESDLLRLSPSLPPSTSMPIHHNYPELLIPSVLQRTNEEIIEVTSPDVIELEAISSTLPDISPDQIVHVKDENDFYDHNETRMNMAQATEQMYNHQYPQPIILLERIRLENYR